MKPSSMGAMGEKVSRRRPMAISATMAITWMSMVLKETRWTPVRENSSTMGMSTGRGTASTQAR